MSACHSRGRSGIGRIEVLVVLLTTALLIPLFICRVAVWRDHNKRLECINNLKQLALACHTFHDANGTLPTEKGRTQLNFYHLIVPWGMGIQTGNEPVKLFLCPSRRTKEMAPGKRDYGYAATNGLGSAGKSILDTPVCVTLSEITKKSGTANTLVLSHLWMDPKHYGGGDPTDLGWFTANNSRSINNTAKEDSDPTGSTSHIGGPHPWSLPSAFADGHVQDIPYDYPYWAALWAWDKPQPIPLP